MTENEAVAAFAHICDTLAKADLGIGCRAEVSKAFGMLGGIIQRQQSAIRELQSLVSKLKKDLEKIATRDESDGGSVERNHTS